MVAVSYDIAIQRLEEMKSRYKEGFSSSDRELLEALNQRLFHKVITKTGCSDCYRDAYIIIFNHLKKEKVMPTLSNYCLKAGAVIHSFGSPDFYTLSVPDKVAEDYLRNDPTNIREFQRFPSDWKERISRTETTSKRKVEQSDQKEEFAKVVTEPQEETIVEPEQKAKMSKHK